MKFIVSLVVNTRDPHPTIGPFRYQPLLKHYAFDGELVDDCAKLADLANKAFEWVRLQENPFLIVQVIPVEDPSAPEVAEPEAPQEVIPPEEPVAQPDPEEPPVPDDETTAPEAQPASQPQSLKERLAPRKDPAQIT